MTVKSRAVPHRVRRSSLSIAIAAALAATVGCVATADARITKVTIDSRGTAFADGASAPAHSIGDGLVV